MPGTKCMGRTRVEKQEKLNFRSFTADDVCSILRSCARSGVKVLKFLDLEVEFFEAQDNKPNLAIKKSIPDAAMSEDKPDDTSQAGPIPISEDEAAALKQMQLDLMLIEDPAQYEHLMAAGELENADSRDTGAE